MPFCSILINVAFMILKGIDHQEIDPSHWSKIKIGYGYSLANKSL